MQILALFLIIIISLIVDLSQASHSLWSMEIGEVQTSCNLPGKHCL